MSVHSALIFFITISSLYFLLHKNTEKQRDKIIHIIIHILIQFPFQH